MDLLVLVACVLLLMGTAAIWGWRFLLLLFLAANLQGNFLRVPALSFPLTRGAQRTENAMRPAASGWQSNGQKFPQSANR